MLPYLRDTVNSAYGRFLALGHEQGQGLLRDIIKENPKTDTKKVISSMGQSRDFKSCEVIHNACSTAAIELDLDIEADVRIIPMVSMQYVIGQKKGSCTI